MVLIDLHVEKPPWPPAATSAVKILARDAFDNGANPRSAPIRGDIKEAVNAGTMARLAAGNGDFGDIIGASTPSSARSTR